MTEDRSALLAYGVLCLIVLGLVGLLVWTGDRAFGRFLGLLPPLGVFAGVAVLGAVLFATVMARAGFAVLRTGEAGWIRAARAAAAFGPVVVTADFFIVFPSDLNVPFPQSLFFYPAVGFLVEILFHVLPLSVLLAPLGFVRTRRGRDRFVYGALAVTALLEPSYQIAALSSSWPPGCRSLCCGQRRSTQLGRALAVPAVRLHHDVRVPADVLLGLARRLGRLAPGHLVLSGEQAFTTAAFSRLGVIAGPAPRAVRSPYRTSRRKPAEQPTRGRDSQRRSRGSHIPKRASISKASRHGIGRRS